MVMLFLVLVCNGIVSVGVWFPEGSIWFLRLVFKEEGSRPFIIVPWVFEVKWCSLRLPGVSSPFSASWLLVWFQSSRMRCGLWCSPNKFRRLMSSSPILLLSRWVLYQFALSYDLLLLICFFTSH